MKDILVSLSIIGSSVAIMGALLYFTIFKEKIVDARIRTLIHNEVLAGNAVAIAIKYDGLHWMVRAENEELIVAAIKGNEYAIKALKIDLEKPNRRY